MTATEVRHTVETLEDLRAIISTPPADSGVRKKDIGYLDEYARMFIAKSPFVLLSTSNAAGQCDVSPRGDGPGFVQVLDDHRLIIPDRPGNRRLDSFENIIENRHAGLLFLVPNVDETLRVNGRASITTDPELLEPMAMKGKVPNLGIIVEVEELFFHCARSFKRASLWNPDKWIDRSELPTLGQMIHGQLKPVDATANEIDEGLEEANRNLY